MIRPAATVERRLLESLTPLEAAAFVACRPLLRRLGRGDQHPVLVIPGFGSDDVWTVPLRWAIRGQGYWVHAWKLGPNVGPTRKVVDGLRARIDELHSRHGRTVSLVGWSLGGVLARTLARERPDRVRQVITLGSPYRTLPRQRRRSAQAGVVRALFDMVAPYHVRDFDITDVDEERRRPLQVPATSIYTRRDDIAAWQTCIDVTGPGAPNPRAENIEVVTTHTGLGANVAVIAAVLDRLATPPEQWTPFVPPRGMRWMYPHPATWVAEEARRSAHTSTERRSRPVASA